MQIPQLAQRPIDHIRATTPEGAGPWIGNRRAYAGFQPRRYCRIGVGRQQDEGAFLESRNRPAVTWRSEGGLETAVGAVSASVRPVPATLSRSTI
jgi:hypothetical protein